MAGIYVHIPFCKQICHYCDFYRVNKVKLLPDFLDALIKEIALKSDYLQNNEIESIYFGGGTPSLLNIQQINRILTVIGNTFQLSSECEITVEANPDDINELYIWHLKEYTMVNRLSLGIQSFFDDDLIFLNRRHHAAQSVSCIKMAEKAGFENTSIDLIYGIPGMTEEKWEQNIRLALNCKISHLSAYNLTIEPQTPLFKMIEEGKTNPLNEEQSYSQYLLLCKTVREYGFEHYEISNYCRYNYYSKHNSNYWKQKMYLGLGPSAHSFNIKSRHWNVSDVSVYLAALKYNESFFEKEIIDETKRINEYIMLSLRTIWGVDAERIESEFGTSAAEQFKNEVSRFLTTGQMIHKGNIYSITEDSWFISDYIISRLMYG